MTKSFRVLFLIRSLDYGGAERQLVQLARGLSSRGIAVAIAVMYSGGALERDAEGDSGVTLIRLDKMSRWDVVGFVRRMLREAARFKPDLVHGYMSGANELALLTGRYLGVPTLWGIRVSDQDFEHYSGFRRSIFLLGKALARFPTGIIANSYKGREFHLRNGYPADSFHVIPNGLNLQRFRRDIGSGLEWRRRHDIAPDRPVVLLPARLDPMKDHRTFVDAIAEFAAQRQDVLFIAIGAGTDESRHAILAHAASVGVGHVLRLLPAEARIEDAYNASSIVTLTSAFGEGFPNVLGEAMACARVCVSTDVGDAAFVLGDVGRVVPIRSPRELSRAWLDMLALDPEQRDELEGRARRRMEERFGVDVLLGETISRFEDALVRARK